MFLPVLLLFLFLELRPYIYRALERLMPKGNYVGFSQSNNRIPKSGESRVAHTKADIDRETLTLELENNLTIERNLIGKSHEEDWRCRANGDERFSDKNGGGASFHTHGIFRTVEHSRYNTNRDRIGCSKQPITSVPNTMPMDPEEVERRLAAPPRRRINLETASWSDPTSWTDPNDIDNNCPECGYPKNPCLCNMDMSQPIFKQGLSKEDFNELWISKFQTHLSHWPRNIQSHESRYWWFER
ncbi:uncharacterized protein MYCFIDRAFT_172770 [Pseudocercospora fijiensis CIRAD86]|uniref:Uncharacterized protein n=1 Tax=Pseudocercospora fijiensis (strain CIRAD86) TaxID=383855 RepID=M3A7P8_PSEFD|nr:uncharacterized protein MYCFIDRAFT_172770 [Pseudocercospora fijiensis CIRAD86]EME87104.1 hypothetical protein MYCFIDRAFT_172770 [Pseudocercospora fijiensis CIRAD86]